MGQKDGDAEAVRAEVLYQLSNRYLKAAIAGEPPPVIDDPEIEKLIGEALKRDCRKVG